MLFNSEIFLFVFLPIAYHFIQPSASHPRDQPAAVSGSAARSNAAAARRRA